MQIEDIEFKGMRETANLTAVKINLQEDGFAIDNSSKVGVKQNTPITLSWENIEVQTASSKESFIGKIMFCKKEIPSKQIVKQGKRCEC